jgi:hypothetical protein
MEEEGCVKKHMSYFTTPTGCSIIPLTVDLQALNTILKQRRNLGWASKTAVPGADDRGKGKLLMSVTPSSKPTYMPKDGGIVCEFKRQL